MGTSGYRKDTHLSRCPGVTGAEGPGVPVTGRGRFLPSPERRRPPGAGNILHGELAGQKHD